MRRGRLLTFLGLFGGVTFTLIAWCLIPTLLAQSDDVTTSILERSRFDVSLQHSVLDAAAQRQGAALEAYDAERGGTGGSRQVGLGERALARARELQAAQFDHYVLQAQLSSVSEAQQRLEQRFQAQQSAISSVRSGVLAIGGGLAAALLIARRRHITSGAALVARIAVGLEQAEELASIRHEMRMATLARRQRWRHRCSLPGMWIYMVFRRWTNALRKLGRGRPHPWT